MRKQKAIPIYQAKRGDPVTMRMLADQRVSVILENFHGVVWQEKVKAFPTFTVFKSPKDYPGKYVVRLFDGTKPTRLITLSDTLEAARKTIPPDFIHTPRSDKDEAHIVETWI